MIPSGYCTGGASGDRSQADIFGLVIRLTSMPSDFSYVFNRELGNDVSLSKPPAKRGRMDRWLSKNSDFLYAVMRLMVGLLFACHGVQKLFGTLGGQSQVSNPMLLVAGIIEFVGGALVAIGLWTSYAAFIASGEMAVAYFIAHAAKGFWPILNKGELAVLYGFVFLYIASRGSGTLSVEAVSKKKKHA